MFVDCEDLSRRPVLSRRLPNVKRMIPSRIVPGAYELRTNLQVSGRATSIPVILIAVATPDDIQRTNKWYLSKKDENSLPRERLVLVLEPALKGAKADIVEMRAELPSDRTSEIAIVRFISSGEHMSNNFGKRKARGRQAELRQLRVAQKVARS